jgi:hypothetical protein
MLIDNYLDVGYKIGLMISFRTSIVVNTLRLRKTIKIRELMLKVVAILKILFKDV